MAQNSFKPKALPGLNRIAKQSIFTLQFTPNAEPARHTESKLQYYFLVEMELWCPPLMAGLPALTTRHLIHRSTCLAKYRSRKSDKCLMGSKQTFVNKNETWRFNYRVAWKTVKDSMGNNDLSLKHVWKICVHVNQEYSNSHLINFVMHQHVIRSPTMMSS